MAFKTATGGNVMLSVSVVVPVGRWTGNWTTALSNVTQSDGNGGTSYFPTNMDPTWSFDAARDDTNYPEAIGLTSGTVVSTLYFRLGAETKADKVVNTTVESVTPVCDPSSNEVVRVTVSGKGGLVTYHQNLPT